MCWCDAFINCQMITSIVSVTASLLLHSYHFGFAVRTCETSLSNTQIYDTVLLSKITLLYSKAPELINLIIGSLYPLSNISPFLPSPDH